MKQKFQNEKIDIHDPYSFDWDNLSETELKRLVIQLEKTRNDLKSDLKEMQWKLDKEGKEFHHHDSFGTMYQAEIKNLNRVLESLMKNGMIIPKLMPVSLVIIILLLNMKINSNNIIFRLHLKQVLIQIPEGFQPQGTNLIQLQKFKRFFPKKVVLCLILQRKNGTLVWIKEKMFVN